MINPSDDPDLRDEDGRSRFRARARTRAIACFSYGRYMAKHSTAWRTTPCSKEADVCRFIHFRRAAIGHPRAARSNYPSINTDPRSVSAAPITSSLFLAFFSVRLIGRLVGRPLFPRASIHIRSSFVDRANRLLASFAQIGARKSALCSITRCAFSSTTRGNAATLIAGNIAAT